MALRLRLKGVAAGLLLLPACGDGGGGGSDFLADNPFGGNGEEGAGDAGTGGAEPADGDAGEDGEDGEREISEADIVQIVDDRLYALSPYGGLTIIDISKPGAFTVLGRYRARAQPFEMYVEGDQVFVMYSDFGKYVWDEAAGGNVWRSSSRLLALDASDPAAVVVRGEYELPGEIQDSRRVGDVLYLVTYENGYCWGCKSDVNTTITSLDVSDVSAIEQVDQLAFVNVHDDPWDWAGPRSVSSTDERMYVAGIEYDNWENAHSTIDVVDISDPGGLLQKGSSFEIPGLIQSRWQMDEHEDVLRVISQPAAWDAEKPPVIETYSVAAADDIVALGSLEMTLPRPESLQAVRFDELRAYAITFEQTDPLFTIDLSDPAEPKQMGELEIPGWVFHMEPRGDRLLGLGFDRDHPDGSINVSLFDVADMANPTLLSRVHFGGDWANFAEGQNRIHKAFTVLDDLGLLLVPFSGWDYDDEECYGRYRSGIQLVDWAQDELALRGVAASPSRSRRALWHDERLLAVSDKSVESFDIADRDAPVRLAEVGLASNVTRVGVGDGIIVRISDDWWTNEQRLEVVAVGDAESTQPLGSMSLSELIRTESPECWETGYYSTDVVVHEGFAYLVRDVWGDADATGSTHIDVIDVRDPTSPAYVKTLELAFSRSSYGHQLGVATGEKATLHVNGALVMAAKNVTWDAELPSSSATFEIVDLTNPGAPSHVATLPRPKALVHGDLLAFGDTLVSWNMQEASEDASKVRYYLERLDLSTPLASKTLPPVNVPGVPAAYDPGTRQVTTVDFQISAESSSEEACWNHADVHSYDYERETCYRVAHALSLLSLGEQGASLVDRSVLDEGELRLRSAVGTKDRIFAHMSEGGDYGYGHDDIGDGFGGTPHAPATEVAVFSGPGANAIEESARLTLEVGNVWGRRFVAAGARLLFNASNALVEIDASNPGAPTLELHELYGGGCWNLEVAGNTVYCPMDAYGLQSIDL